MQLYCGLAKSYRLLPAVSRLYGYFYFSVKGGNTAAMHASIEGHENCLRQLIAAGANLEHKDKAREYIQISLTIVPALTPPQTRKRTEACLII